MRDRRYSPAENATKESLKLREGEGYTLIFIERPEEGKKRVQKKTKDAPDQMLSASRGIRRYKGDTAFISILGY